MRIALVTDGREGLSESDAALESALNAAHAEVKSQRWDDPGVVWQAYDAVVVRACWDYHLAPHDFSAWIRRCQGLGVNLVNGAEMLLWNMHKRYLFDLELPRGMRLPPTTLVERGDQRPLAQILVELGAREVVVKPAISAGAWKTLRASAVATECQELEFRETLAGRDMLIQEFEAGIAEGELSFVYLVGEYSHLVRKVAAHGDYRVQAEHGGYYAAEQADGQDLCLVDALMRKLPWPWMYARADLVRGRDGQLVLMELELIEPDLFLHLSPAAAGLLATAIVAGATTRHPAGR